MERRWQLAARLPRPVAYVLGGGGSWGALQVGMLQALARSDLSPDLIVGTSVGSLNGAVIAWDPTAGAGLLGKRWPSVTRADVLPGSWIRSLRTLQETKAWIHDSQPLAEFLMALLPARTFEDLRVPFVAVATDFTTGTLVELDCGDLPSALVASSAIPGIFPWVQRDGRRLVDGGLVATVPISVAIRRGARSLVVLDCGLGVGSEDASTLVEVLAHAAAIYARHQMACDLLQCSGMPVVWLSPRRARRTNPLDFTATVALIAEGYTLGCDVLSSLAQGAPTVLTPLAAGLYGSTAEFRGDPVLGPMLR